MQPFVDNSELKIDILEKNVALFNEGNREAQKQLMEFAENPLSTLYSVKIIKNAKAAESKSYGLTILLRSVKSRWQLFKPQEKIEIRTFSIKLLLEYLSDKDSGNMSSLIPSVNNIIIEIAKKEWPLKWPEFIPELISACKISDAVCANNMNLLRMLVEEVNENEEKLTSKQKREMKPMLSKAFADIFKLCIMVLNSSENVALVKPTLMALNSFILFLPKIYVFESVLIKRLVFKFYAIDELKNSVVQCLSAIAAVDITNEKASYKDVIKNMFRFFTQKTVDIASENFDLCTAYREGNNEFKSLVLFLANFYVTILVRYSAIFEGSGDLNKEIIIANYILVKISSVEDSEIFKICLEYWKTITTKLVQQKRRNESPVALGRMHKIDESSLKMYSPVLSGLRRILITRMERPKEVLLCEDENGRVVLEELAESYNREMYALTKECLFNCTELDGTETKHLMFSILDEQVAREDIQITRLNTLAWSAGSISGALGVEEEKGFLVRIIKELLKMCDQGRGKAQKAVIASCIMYVVGQYPRFLKKHWSFLKTVISKLFEFMHESFPGVKEMAVETFAAIAGRCAGELVSPQEDEIFGQPFLAVILREVGRTASGLEDPQAELFYEAVARIVAAEEKPELRKKLIAELLAEPNRVWQRVVQGNDPKALANGEAAKRLSKALRLNASAAKGLGSHFSSQLEALSKPLLGLFEFLTRFVSEAVSASGEDALWRRQNLKEVQNLKAEILRLFETYLRNVNESEAETLFTQFGPALFASLLQSYNHFPPCTRDHNVLSLLAVFLSKSTKKISEKKYFDIIMPNTFEIVVQNTFQTIQQNFNDLPEHRRKLFFLLKTLVRFYLPQMLKELSKQHLELLFSVVFYGIKHTKIEVSELSLETIMEMIRRIERTSMFNEFYKYNLLRILTEIFIVMTDTLHKNGIELQTEIMSKSLSLVQNGDLTLPIYENLSKFPSNRAFVSGFLKEFVLKTFSNRFTIEEIEEFVGEMMKKSNNLEEFRTTVNDFLLGLGEMKAVNGYV